jgi:drug/metabolite transporter (DMT)-like permease
VACYQWALRTTATGKVLAIVAMSPLVTLLLTWFIDGTRPTRDRFAVASWPFWGDRPEVFFFPGMNGWPGTLSLNHL